jgi:hypothetical protein
LGQFIQFVSPEKKSCACDPGITGPNRKPALFIRTCEHRPEFEQAKIPVVLSHPFLHIKYSPVGIDHQDNANDEEKRKKENQSKK